MACAMRSAILRRRPMTLISVRPVFGCSAAGARPPAAAKASKSFFRMRPRGPLPGTCVRSMPASRARARIEGEVITLPGLEPSDTAAAQHAQQHPVHAQGKQVRMQQEQPL